MSLLTMNGVTYEDKGNTIINDFNFQVEKKDYISIIGPSGSGKSTILKLFASLISPSKGAIYFKGEDYISSSPYNLRKNITYCFQTPILFGDSIFDNFEFPYTVRQKNIDTDRINYLLNLFGFSESILHNSIHKLSGGEKQRIALIRSIIFQPEVLLLDEITSALDVENTKIVESIIEKLNLEGMTILWVTHNLEQSRKYANKILTIEKGRLKNLEVIK